MKNDYVLRTPFFLVHPVHNLVPQRFRSLERCHGCHHQKTIKNMPFATLLQFSQCMLNVKKVDMWYIQIIWHSTHLTFLTRTHKEGMQVMLSCSCAPGKCKPIIWDIIILSHLRNIIMITVTYKEKSLLLLAMSKSIFSVRFCFILEKVNRFTLTPSLNVFVCTNYRSIGVSPWWLIETRGT